MRYVILTLGLSFALVGCKETAKSAKSTDSSSTSPVFQSGDKGEKGDKGDKGDTGDKGLMGDKGLSGDKGATGDKGPQGDVGPSGGHAKEFWVVKADGSGDIAPLLSFLGTSNAVVLWDDANEMVMPYTMDVDDASVMQMQYYPHRVVFSTTDCTGTHHLPTTSLQGPPLVGTGIRHANQVYKVSSYSTFRGVAFKEYEPLTSSFGACQIVDLGIQAWPTLSPVTSTLPAKLTSGSYKVIRR